MKYGSITITRTRGKGLSIRTTAYAIPITAKNIREAQKAITHTFGEPHAPINCPICRELGVWDT